MKRWYIYVLSASLLTLTLFGYFVMKNPIREAYISPSSYYNTTTANINPLEWIKSIETPVHNPESDSQVVSTDEIVSTLFIQRNISVQERQPLYTWNHLKHLISHDRVLPNTVEAIKDAGIAWDNLMNSVEDERQNMNGSSGSKKKEKQCPHYLSKMNASELNDTGYKLTVPCGLTQGSSVTFIGIPNGLLGNFRIDLTGEPLPGEPDPPVILHYNVRLHGDKITEDPVIVQNTWTIGHDWGEEERCPNPEPNKNKKVDELDQCNEKVGKVINGSKTRNYFPFKQGYISVSTLRVGSEGIQMTVDGKHITSFAFRETLEPWLVSEIRISGDLKLVSVVASGLPTSEDSEHVIDLESLKSPPIPLKKKINLLIGVFSTANNFKRRMAVRRTWMQYPQVKSGEVAVRFFVGLTEVISAKYVMKTDDDAFVRVDEILASLKRVNVSHGLLYGLINSDSQPHRNPDSKWYISPKEWPEEKYPPWAHGPGYVVSHDIAKAINNKHKKGHLKMFKLEDVAMGIWIADLKKNGLEVRYEKEERVYNEGCKDGYVVAHYQGPREMLCLWQKLQEDKRAFCCGN
ncbi:hypothetical protein R6Q57_022158 [Mikania cordata]